MPHPPARFVEVQHDEHISLARASARADGTRLLVFEGVVELEKGSTIRVDGEPCEVMVAADEWCIVEGWGEQTRFTGVRTDFR